MAKQRNGESWRRWLDREVRSLEEKLEYLEERINLQLAAIAKALEKQEIEDERRLGILNHASARAEAATARTVSLEKYEADREADRVSMDLIRVKVLEEASKLAGREIQKSKNAAMILAALALGISFFGLIVRVIW